MRESKDHMDLRKVVLLSLPVITGRNRCLSTFKKLWFGGLFLFSTITGWALDGGFTNVTSVAGIDHVQYAEDFEVTSEHQILTGGAAAGDFDGDGWVDLFVTRLDNFDILYRNLGAERNGVGPWFERVPKENGFSVVDKTNGAAWGDIDNDGDLDLYMSVIEGPRFYLYLNNGDGTFNEEGIERGAALESDLDHNGYSVTFGDYDRDGWLDIHTCEWDIDNDHPSSGNHSVLLRNRGADAPGHFENVTEAAGVALDHVPIQYAFTSSFSDLDGDGWPDLVIASDFSGSRLYWNNGDGTFSDGTEVGGVNKGKNEMGSTIADFDQDGLLDWFVTSTEFDNRMYRNLGNRTFSEDATSLGIENGEWGWGTQLLDFDNDADYDLLMTNGWHIFNDPLPKDNFATPSFFWKNEDGVFTETVAAQTGLWDEGEGKGLLTFDYDQDGDLDVYIANNGGAPVLYRNDSNTGNSWVQFKLQGDKSNTRGIGARINVFNAEGSLPSIFEITGASHFCAQSEALVQVGLGPMVDPIESVEIHWPSGKRQILGQVAINQRHIITEPVFKGYQFWSSEQFQPEQLEDMSVIGEDVDFDYDGMTNLLEYALGYDPTQADTGTFINLRKEDGMYELSHTKRKVTDDLLIQYESSTDLVSWVQMDDYEATITPGADNDLCQLRFSEFPERTFIRIRLVKTP